MHITVVAVGLRQPAWADEAVRDYLGRFPKDFTVVVKEVKAEPRAGQPAAKLMQLEAERIRKAIPAGDIVVAMDEHGRDFTTMDICEKSRRVEKRGLRRDVFDRRRRRTRSRIKEGLPHDAATLFNDAAARLCPRHAR